mgnify:CR=1 FL=1
MHDQWHLIEPLKEMVTYANVHVEELSEELQIEALMLEHLFNDLNIASVTKLLSTVKKIQETIAQTLSNEAGKTWEMFVKQQSAKGGGALFKYIAKSDQEFLNVSWSSTKGVDISPDCFCKTN